MPTLEEETIEQQIAAATALKATLKAQLATLVAAKNAAAFAAAQVPPTQQQTLDNLNTLNAGLQSQIASFG